MLMLLCASFAELWWPGHALTRGRLFFGLGVVNTELFALSKSKNVCATGFESEPQHCIYRDTTPTQRAPRMYCCHGVCVWARLGIEQ